MNPLTKLRDWWFRPVTDRLDRIEAAVSKQYYVLGAREEDIRELNQRCHVEPTPSVKARLDRLGDAVRLNRSAWQR